MWESVCRVSFHYLGRKGVIFFPDFIAVPFVEFLYCLCRNHKHIHLQEEADVIVLETQQVKVLHTWYSTEQSAKGCQ